jgi:hypothetical protein
MESYKLDNHYNKLIQQTIDILIYDYKNKYDSLRMNGLNTDDIDRYMDEYQKTRTKNFVMDLKRIQQICKN